MNSHADLIEKQQALIHALRDELTQSDIYIEALKGYVQEQKDLIIEFRVQIDSCQELLLKRGRETYQPRRSRSWNANFWPRLEKASGPLDTEWGNSESRASQDEKQE